MLFYLDSSHLFQDSFHISSRSSRTSSNLWLHWQESDLFYEMEALGNYMKYRHGFLVATTRHQEDPFFKSVVYLCEHSEQGSLGLIINKPLNVSLKDLSRTGLASQSLIPVYLGGPLQAQDRGFVLHRNLGQYWQGTAQLASDLYLTTTGDILRDIEQFPEDLYKVIVGYTGWSDGQLEYEMSQDYWVWLPYDPIVLFFTQTQDIWLHCYSLLGFAPDQLGCVDPGVIFKH